MNSFDSYSHVIDKDYVLGLLSKSLRCNILVNTYIKWKLMMPSFKSGMWCCLDYCSLFQIKTADIICTAAWFSFDQHLCSQECCILRCSLSVHHSNHFIFFRYVRAEVLAGFVNALFLLFIGFFILSEAVEVEQNSIMYRTIIVYHNSLFFN